MVAQTDKLDELGLREKTLVLFTATTAPPLV